MEEKQKKDELFKKMMDLEFEIIRHSMSYSQSNPGAVMHLRDMKKELEKIKTTLFYEK
jgi:hypothetical protein